jgi:hypothetical protein
MCWEFLHGLADISISSRARSEGSNLLIFANQCQNSKRILASMIYFESDKSKSTNTVVYFDWKTVIYIYACGKCQWKSQSHSPAHVLMRLYRMDSLLVC